MSARLASSSRRAAAFGLAFLIAGCASSPPPHLYTLASRPGQAAGGTRLTVSLRTLSIPRYLDRPEVVRKRGDYEIAVTDLERWGEDVPGMIRRVLLENLAVRLPAAEVFSADTFGGLAADTTLDLEIDRFDAEPNGTVLLAARWVAGGERRRAQLRAERIAVTAASPATADLAAAMSEALGQLADHIAGELAGRR